MPNPQTTDPRERLINVLTGDLMRLNGYGYPITDNEAQENILAAAEAYAAAKVREALEKIISLAEEKSPSKSRRSKDEELNAYDVGLWTIASEADRLRAALPGQARLSPSPETFLRPTRSKNP